MFERKTKKKNKANIFMTTFSSEKLTFFVSILKIIGFFKDELDHGQVLDTVN